MARFYRSLVFRLGLRIVVLVVALEVVVFGVLYWSTVLLYEQRANDAIHGDAESLQQELVGMSVMNMAAIVTSRCDDEPGEHDEYLLTTSDLEYIAGNVREWPAGLAPGPELVDLVLGMQKQHPDELHRVRAVVLASGHHLLVGRNLTEFQEMRELIGRALLRTVALTAILGCGGGYFISRRVASRLDRINTTAAARLTGDFRRRIPVSPAGDEFDELSENLNHTMDRIDALMEGMRTMTDNIAHDLRKPISRLRTRIELALMGPRDPEVYVDALTRTVEEIDELLKVFNALLTIALAEAGPTREFEEIDLVDIARSTVELYEPVADEAGLSLELQADEAVSVPGDPHLVSQAAANLVENAIRHAPGSGSVTIGAKRVAEGVQLTVADRGPGIPAWFRSKAFDRFARLEDSRSTPGSGLGLSLVRAVALMHGGTVELDDNDPGLVVTLTLPLSGSRSLA
jgi:signal transduction histidine kinase